MVAALLGGGLAEDERALALDEPAADGAAERQHEGVAGPQPVARTAARAGCAEFGPAYTSPPASSETTTTSACSAYIRPVPVRVTCAASSASVGSCAAGGDGVRDQRDAGFEHEVGDPGRLPVQRDLLGRLDVARAG